MFCELDDAGLSDPVRIAERLTCSSDTLHALEGLTFSLYKYRVPGEELVAHKRGKDCWHTVSGIGIAVGIWMTVPPAL